MLLVKINPLKQYDDRYIFLHHLISMKCSSADLCFFQLISLIADVGGNMGLFLGFSIASILEIVEFFFDIFRVGGRCNCMGGNTKVKPPQQLMTPVPLPKSVTATSPKGSDMNIDLLDRGECPPGQRWVSSWTDVGDHLIDRGGCLSHRQRWVSLSSTEVGVKGASRVNITQL